MNEMQFKEKIKNTVEQFISYKRSVGYSYSGSIIYQLNDIQNLIVEFHIINNILDDPFLTKDCVNYILSKKQGSQKRSYASLIRSFGLYLDNTGSEAYVIPKRLLPVHARQFNPYIFDHKEICLVIKAVDNYCQSHLKLNNYIKKVMPFIIRLLYSCGLRISEALKLEKKGYVKKFTDKCIDCPINLS